MSVCFLIDLSISTSIGYFYDQRPINFCTVFFSCRDIFEKKQLLPKYHWNYLLNLEFSIFYCFFVIVWNYFQFSKKKKKEIRFGKGKIKQKQTGRCITVFWCNRLRFTHLMNHRWRLSLFEDFPRMMFSDRKTNNAPKQSNINCGQFGTKKKLGHLIVVVWSSLFLFIGYRLF